MICFIRQSCCSFSPAGLVKSFYQTSGDSTFLKRGKLLIVAFNGLLLHLSMVCSSMGGRGRERRGEGNPREFEFMKLYPGQLSPSPEDCNKVLRVPGFVYLTLMIPVRLRLPPPPPPPSSQPMLGQTVDRWAPSICGNDWNSFHPKSEHSKFEIMPPWRQLHFK